MRRSTRVWRVVRKIWITVGLSATAVFVVWSILAYRATPEARAAMIPNSSVVVDEADGIWRFSRPDVDNSRVTLLFFPGALVDPHAYAPLARAVAEAGYPVVVVTLPKRGAFGGAESPELQLRINSILNDSTTHRIIAAGHSRGAVVASRLAANSAARLSGLVIIGSSHPRDHDLSSLAIPVTKIVGTRDGLASPSEVKQNAHLLPQHTHWIWIEGGNHSQFGWYGFQPLDRRPRTDAAIQRSIMIRGVVDLLKQVAQQP